MAGRMTVVAVRHTGHVLGAITAVAPGDAPSVASVAGAAMPVYVDPVTFAVPAAALAVADLGFDDKVFEDPRRAQVLFPGASDQSASLAFVDSDPVNAGQVSATATTLTVTIPTAPTKDLPFWLQLQGPDEDQQIVIGVIPATKTASDPVAHALTSGTSYDGLLLITGLAPDLQPGIQPP